MTIVPLIYNFQTQGQVQTRYMPFLLIEAEKMEKHILKWLSGSDFLATG
jgi:hypothetical protein